MNAKRLFDFGLALLLSVPALILVGLAAIPAWIDCGASPLFVQRRVGRGRRNFSLLKLRTMRISTLHMPSHEVPIGQITSSGRLLRRFKLDELPQIWNVLVGEMSFVGPRPCLPSQVELIEMRARLGVYDLLPGITGPAQVRGIDMSTPEILAQVDAEYCVPWSFSRDLRLIMATATGAGSGDAATRAR